MTSGNTGGKATRRRVPIQDGVENWRSRRRSSSIFADAAAVIPPGGTSTAAATVEQTADQRWEESEDEGERPHSSLARTMEYDGERVLEETWAKVNTLRRMAESSGISGKDVATEVVAWWRRGSENEGEGGLTDVDLLRFIMYRYDPSGTNVGVRCTGQTFTLCEGGGRVGEFAMFASRLERGESLQSLRVPAIIKSTPVAHHMQS